MGCHVILHEAWIMDWVSKRTKSGSEGFIDADGGNCIIDIISYSGYSFILSGARITCEVRKQRTVALSSIGVEYMALTEADKEAV